MNAPGLKQIGNTLGMRQPQQQPQPQGIGPSQPAMGGMMEKIKSPMQSPPMMPGQFDMSQVPGGGYMGGMKEKEVGGVGPSLGGMQQMLQQQYSQQQPPDQPPQGRMPDFWREPLNRGYGRM